MNDRVRLNELTNESAAAPGATEAMPASSVNRPAGRYRLGIDIGGTFTDLSLHDSRESTFTVAKVLSTPADPSIGALRGVDAILQAAGVTLDQIGEVVHATTHGANIIIEGRGARTGLLITEGFGD